jgi:serine/threonine protein kinase
MGEVYRARDTRLGRLVALKVLPAAFTQDEDRLRRFSQEARAASALNHPNILTIYDIGNADGIEFIAAELVEGETLRAQIASAGMKLPAALDVAIQIASALSAAHEAGIIHRDIKPDNIMVRPDGYVKVLDFGLAKLTERPTDGDASTHAMAGTSPGVAMGTVQYMSPEQARGRGLDTRTDIFSLGAVLYETIAGRPAFNGASAADVFVAILDKEPTRLAALAPGISTELERIVFKAMAKDREERYQTVKDLLIDVKRLGQRLQFEAELARSPATGSTVMAGAREIVDVPPAGTPAPGRSDTPRPISSAEYVVTEIKRHKFGATLALGVVVVAIAGAIAVWYAGHRASPSSVQLSSPSFKLTPITTNGNAVDAAVSPDGKLVVYAMSQEDGGQSLWLRQVAIASNAPIVPAEEVQYSHLTFSPDGNFIYYRAARRGGADPPSIFRMTSLGRDPRPVVVQAESLGLSPDGRELAFVRRGGRGGGSLKPGFDLIAANVDGTNERKLATRTQPDNFGQGGPLAWAPDGKVIVCLKGTVGADAFDSLVAVKVSDGTETPIGSHRWAKVSGATWLPDGTGLIVAAFDRESSLGSQIWRVAYPGGEETRITNDLNDYRSVSLGGDAGALVTTQESLSLGLWVMPAGDPTHAGEIKGRTGKSDGQWGLAWTPDGRVVYTSTASGAIDLWIMNADGGDQRQLTMKAGRNFFPTISRDGRYVVFVSDRAGQAGLWRVNLDGSSPRQLTTTGSRPSVSPDGTGVIYCRDTPCTPSRVPIDGGDSVLLVAADGVHYPAVSPNGKFVAFFSGGAAGPIALFPFEGGPAVKTLDRPLRLSLLPGLHWTPDGLALTYAYGSNIWSQPIAGGPPKQLTDFTSMQIHQFDWSSDGRLIVSRGTTSRDVVLMTGFR